ncbi:Na+/proline symporter [Natronocella acetinitrilica]|uniref:Na+/proline symporter n=1 Tax=Natronocella acetinitrilica TaxID=414046 RepID=A0AAE3G456_9GAMM|nr:sodium:solute symporter [Natronocella acetinitrilica]MCP1674759.1 Na+/proline symporter [Natronocella acetinitrilica]
MEAKAIWLFIFVALYWGYCIFWGVKSALAAKTASDYFVAGRSISMWVFILAATATSFSGWTFVGHPGSIYAEGLQYAYASFYAITIPFTGLLFLKRQWMIGKRWGYVTPGEMFSHYFNSEAIRILVVLVALIFSIPYVGIQLRASGFLFNVLTDGWLGVEVGMWMLSAVVLLYVASGGLRAVAYVDAAQCILLAGGIVIIGCVAMYNVGGWGVFTDGLAAFTLTDTNRTPDGYSGYIAVPGVIQWVSAGPSAQGGPWTGIMILTYMFALMGIQSSPAFTMWSFSNHNPKPFAPQQVWASSFGIGLILFTFTAFQGVGGHLLGGDPEFAQDNPEIVTNPVLQRGIIATQNPELTWAEVDERVQAGLDAIQRGESPDTWIALRDAGGDGALVPQLIALLGEAAPWLVGLLAVCALAAMQSTGAAYMSTAGGMLTRDILKRYIMPNADHKVQKFAGRLGVLFITGAALTTATVATDALVLLGGLAVAYGFQMWPALIAICFWPWLTRQGVVLGLIAGLIAVSLTENVGINLLGIEAWGRWPLTIHSAGWGILFNLGIAIAVSAVTQNKAETEHRMQIHNFLREHASVPEAKRHLIPIGWILALTWFFFGIGPGAVIGNWIFGNPNDPATWMFFGLPSIWTWQLLWWALGVFMMWFLAYKLHMSTVPDREVEVLVEDIDALKTDSRAST